MDQSAHIKRLEKKIHNQRRQLRMNWEILEQRQEGLGVYIKPRYLEVALKQNKEIQLLKARVAELEKAQ